MKKMMKGLALISDELNISIPDPVAEWKATNVTWQAIEAKKAVKKNLNPLPCRTEEDEKNITINVADQQPWYQKDLIALNDPDDENNWCKPGDWRDRLNDVDEEQEKNEDEDFLRYLNEVEKDADFEEFETLYK